MQLNLFSEQITFKCGGQQQGKLSFLLSVKYFYVRLGSANKQWRVSFFLTAVKSNLHWLMGQHSCGNVLTEVSKKGVMHLGIMLKC